MLALASAALRPTWGILLLNKPLEHEARTNVVKRHMSRLRIAQQLHAAYQDFLPPRTQAQQSYTLLSRDNNTPVNLREEKQQLKQTHVENRLRH